MTSTKFYTKSVQTERVHSHKGSNFLLLLPLFGCLLFVVLYIAATVYYPGGSSFNKQAKGFTWTQNYWCNLLSKEAINGAVNTARPIAFAAMIVLCFSLALFWWVFPRQIDFTKKARLLFQISGVLSMIVAGFIFTAFHDAVINVAGCLGLVALTGNFIGLKKLRRTGLFWMGLGMLPLIALNNLLYYQISLQVYLPVVQKVTFVYFLVWISSVSLGLYQRKEMNKA